MSRVRGEGFRRVEQEVAGEKAAALGRAGERLEAALAALRAIGDRLSGLVEPVDHGRLTSEYEQALRRAREARLALLIQREALGLRRHAVVDERFPEPARRPLAGPRQR